MYSKDRLKKWIRSACVVSLLSMTGLPAQETNDLVFMHHSCGANWLSNSLNAALVAKAYIDARNDIYYGTAMSPDAGRPASLGGTPGDNTNMNHWVLWFNDYLQGVKARQCADGYNRIVMFKSCYPISDVGGDGTEPGNPFSSSQTIANYKAVYRHYSGPGSTYSNGGYAYSPLEDIFAAHPEILFIPVIAPPLNYSSTSDANAHRARVFNNWLKNEWLPSYNAAHPALDNVAVFDWFDFLAYPDDHGSHPNRLKEEYGGSTGDSHPNAAANSASTVEFATKSGNFIDTAWNGFSTILDTPNDLRASLVNNHILLEWSPISSATGYNVYRGTRYDFIPDLAGGSNRIATNVTDEDAGTSGVQWTDPATAVGDTTTHYFWKVTGLKTGEESNPSNSAGEFAFPLYSTPGTDINEILLGMNTRQTRNPIRTAEELCNAIPNCSVVYCWDPVNQGAVGHPKGLPFNNFTVRQGYPYSVNVPVTGIWTVTGAVPDTSFNLVTTAGTDINHIGMPFEKSAAIINAEQLVSDITGGTTVYMWAPKQQGSIGHPKGMPFNNFIVKANCPYYVNVTSSSVWPSAGSPSPMKKSIAMDVPSALGSSNGLSGGVPHLVFGKYRYSQNIPKSVITQKLAMRAWVTSRLDEVLTEKSAGAGYDSTYCWINVGGFKTPWKTGEELVVVLENGANVLAGRARIQLSTEGADVLDSLVINEPLKMTDVKDGQSAVPGRYSLSGNYPNPFNPATIIEYGLPERAEIRLEVFDLNGRTVKVLHSGVKEAGEHRVNWDATDNYGRKVISGIYLCKMTTASHVKTRKMLLVR